MYIVEAEKNDALLIRILSAITRRRMQLISFHSNVKSGDELLHVTFTVEEGNESVLKLLKQLEKQIDITSVKFFEQQNEPVCKTEHPESFSTL
ncbi:hypothetical protein GCM10023229_03050 [Flavisolibacter ginsenosidimutans]